MENSGEKRLLQFGENYAYKILDFISLLLLLFLSMLLVFPLLSPTPKPECACPMKRRCFSSSIQLRSIMSKFLAERKVTRVAVVTGANKGLGLAIVGGLCRQFRGDVYLTSRDGVRGQDAIERLQCEGFMPKYQQLDITDAESILKLKGYMMDKYGGIDVLVNNAGIAFSPASSVPVQEQAQSTIDTNFTGTLNMMRTFASITRPHGRIVNLSSFVCDLSRLRSKKLRDRFNSPSLTEDELVNLMEEYLSAVKEDKVNENGWGIGHYAASKMGITAMTQVFARETDAVGMV